MHLFLYDDLNLQLHVEVNEICKIKRSIRKWAGVYFSMRRASPVSRRLQRHEQYIKRPSEIWQKQNSGKD